RGLGDMETDAALAPLHGLPAFQEIFERFRESLRQAVWEGWPTGLPVPPRLRQLAAHTSYPKYATFGDFEFDCSDDGFLESQNKGDDADVLGELQEQLPYFAQEGTGGRLMLWMKGPDQERWPVVWYDS